jgi:hypothetical protein
MIIYWGTLEKSAADSVKVPDYIASTDFMRGLNIQPITWDGWLEAKETWTYASATTITVPAGALNKYNKGDKIKLTQTTVKYFYIVDVADTTLTITGGTSYTLANAAITNNFYSKASTPLGFPPSFSYTPTYTFTATTAPSGDISYENRCFSINGGILTVRASRIYATAGTGVTRCDITLPFTVPSSVDQSAIGGAAMANAFTPVAVFNQQTSSQAQLFCVSSTIDRLGFFVSLEI